MPRMISLSYMCLPWRLRACCLLVWMPCWSHTFHHFTAICFVSASIPSRSASSASALCDLLQAFQIEPLSTLGFQQCWVQQWNHIAPYVWWKDATRFRQELGPRTGQPWAGSRWLKTVRRSANRPATEKRRMFGFMMSSQLKHQETWHPQTCGSFISLWVDLNTCVWYLCS